MSETARPTVLVVDDTAQNLGLMHELLRPHYRVLVADSGPRALQLLQEGTRPDLILLDVMMPDMDGYEVLRRLKAEAGSRDTPVIFLTARSDEAGEARGLELGAVDYIIKPISPPIVLARVRNHLLLKASADFLRDKAAFLETEVARRTRRIEAVQDATVLAMSAMVETRDNETGNHILRTQRYVRCLADRLRTHPRFAAQLDEDSIVLICKSAPLHDIGKVGIPDHILLKPGKLSADEFEVMKRHAALGRDAIERAERALGMELDFLRPAKEIAHSHHEKWDGSGYPQGLAGEAIPLAARLMAVADVYDALISRRVYKAPFSHEIALQTMREGRGTHFDPDMLDAFAADHEEFHAIALSLADRD